MSARRGKAYSQDLRDWVISAARPAPNRVVAKRLASARRAFLDGTLAPTAMARRKAGSPSGMRAFGKDSHGRWKAMTFTADLAIDGVRAAFVIDRAMTAEIVGIMSSTPSPRSCGPETSSCKIPPRTKCQAFPGKKHGACLSISRYITVHMSK